MRKQRPARTVAEIAMARSGFRGATRAITFIALWGTVAENMGRAPSMEEYAEFWFKSRATSYREKQAYEVCFPDVPIEQMWENARRQVKSRGQTAVFEVGALALA